MDTVLFLYAGLSRTGAPRGLPVRAGWPGEAGRGGHERPSFKSINLLFAADQARAANQTPAPGFADQRNKSAPPAGAFCVLFLVRTAMHIGFQPIRCWPCLRPAPCRDAVTRSCCGCIIIITVFGDSRNLLLVGDNRKLIDLRILLGFGGLGRLAAFSLDPFLHAADGRSAESDRVTKLPARATWLRCNTGAMAVVEALLVAGADTDAKLQSGCSALFSASQYGHLAVVEARWPLHRRVVGILNDQGTSSGVTRLPDRAFNRSAGPGNVVLHASPYLAGTCWQY
jgi:hypothetical protein